MNEVQVSATRIEALEEVHLDPARGSGRWARLSLIGVAVLAVGGVIGWAAATVLTPPNDVLDSTAYTYVEVVDGEVQSSFRVGTVAEWRAVPIGTNQAAGVVTSVDVSPGQEVGIGAVLYTVNLRPVVIAQGEVPAFRSMARGSTGADVAQLQAMLAALGNYQGPADGRFGAATDRAVRAWQKGLGLSADGVVNWGDVIFVTSLPTRVSLDPEVIARANAVAGGEEAIRGLTDEPSFTVDLTAAQAREMPVGSRVDVRGPQGQQWEGVIVEQKAGEDQGTVTAILAGENGTSLCGEDCTEIPVAGVTLLQSEVVTVERQSGLVVPVAALRTTAAGEVTVIDDEGDPHSVRLIASARGMAVITGVERGLLVRIPADGE
jgi:peptidoglycan hydrolase-like protein with peptidoglycan-binding domain